MVSRIAFDVEGNKCTGYKNARSPHPKSTEGEQVPAAAKAYHLTFSARIQHKTVERGSHTARRRATACGIRLEDHGHISHLGTHSNPNPKPEIWDHTSTKIATAAQQPARHSSEAGIAHVEHSKTSTRNSVAGFLFSRQEARYVRLQGFSSL